MQPASSARGQTIWDMVVEVMIVLPARLATLLAMSEPLNIGKIASRYMKINQEFQSSQITHARYNCSRYSAGSAYPSKGLAFYKASLGLYPQQPRDLARLCVRCPLPPQQAVRYRERPH